MTLPDWILEIENYYPIDGLEKYQLRQEERDIHRLLDSLKIALESLDEEKRRSQYYWNALNDEIQSDFLIKTMDSLKIAVEVLEFYASFGANLKSTRYYDSNMGLGQEAREALAKIRGEK